MLRAIIRWLGQSEYRRGCFDGAEAALRWHRAGSMDVTEIARLATFDVWPWLIKTKTPVELGWHKHRGIWEMHDISKVGGERG